MQVRSNSNLSRISDTRASSNTQLPHTATSERAFDAEMVPELNTSTPTTPLLKQPINKQNSPLLGALLSVAAGVCVTTLLNEIVFNSNITNKPSEALHLTSRLLKTLASIGLGATTTVIGGVIAYLKNKTTDNNSPMHNIQEASDTEKV